MRQRRIRQPSEMVISRNSSWEKRANLQVDHDYDEHGENRTKAKQRTKDKQNNNKYAKMFAKVWRCWHITRVPRYDNNRMCDIEQDDTQRCICKT